VKAHLPHVVYEATRQCNLVCEYCYNYWNSEIDIPMEEISFGQSVKTLRKLFAMADVDRIIFSGGEPFLAERFLELVLLCRMKGASISIISNGTVGTREDYQQLLDMGVSLFEFPLHSSIDSIHDRMTGIAGSWRCSKKSLCEVLELGGEVVPVVVLTNYNIKGLEQTLVYLKSLGVNSVMLARFNIGGRGIRHQVELLVPAGELCNAFSIANESSRQTGLSISANVCTPHCFINPAEYPNIKFSSCSSEVKNRPVTLDFEGNLRLCNHSPKIAGNIFENSVEDIFLCDYVRCWKEIIPSRCQTCSAWKACLGGCRAASEQLGTGLEQADPILQYKRSGIMI
jgi:radical SAM protein with 4Fe4S-binding SPASM domain